MKYKVQKSDEGVCVDCYYDPEYLGLGLIGSWCVVDNCPTALFETEEAAQKAIIGNQNSGICTVVPESTPEQREVSHE